MNSINVQRYETMKREVTKETWKPDSTIVRQQLLHDLVRTKPVQGRLQRKATFEIIFQNQLDPSQTDSVSQTII